MEAYRTRASLSGIVIGALIGIALQVVFVVLGGALGLSSLEVESGDIGRGTVIATGVLAAIALIVSYFIGGYVASRVTRQVTRFDAVIHGLGVWALITLSAVLLLASSASAMSGLLARAGIAVGAGVGAQTVFQEIIREVRRLNPRIITDMNILKGKAITTIETTPIRSEPTERAESRIESKIRKEARQATGEPTAEKAVKEVAQDVRRTAASAGWLALAALIASAGASALGGSRGRRPTEPTSPGGARSEPRKAA